MKTPLVRLLHLRALVEESSRMELERRAAVAAAIEQARERERENARLSRARAGNAILHSSTMAAAEQLPDLGRLREAEWQSAAASAKREQSILPMVQAAERRVSEEREVFMERRKQRRQIERMVESAAESARLERERHEQRELDDWFGIKQSRESPAK